MKKIVRAIWELNSTANPAHFHSNWAGLPHFFSYFLHIFFELYNYYTNAPTFFTHNISAIGGVYNA